jgi:polyisoprenoid-binding protein YceI
MKAATLTVPLLAAAILAAGTASAARYEIVPGGKNRVTFVSKATMETFDGHTDRVRGTVEFDPADLADSARVHVEVDLASLDTGIELRNRHMRQNHLETDKYPQAIFEGGTILEPSAKSLDPGQAVTFALAGSLTVHGVTRPVDVPVRVSRESVDGKDELHMTTSFPLSLEDYGIDRPQFLVMKLADRQEIRLDLTAVTAP